MGTTPSESGTADVEKGTTPVERGTALANAAPTAGASLASLRRAAIVSKHDAEFELDENPGAKPYAAPWWARESDEAVTTHAQLIEEAASRHGVDPDLVKAIVWMETTHGWLDELTGYIKMPKTLRPMNVYVDYWKDLGVTRDELKDPEANIDTGVYLIAAISKRTKDPTVEKVATLYNKLGATQVTEYGKTIQVYYQEKPWLTMSPEATKKRLPLPALHQLFGRRH